MGLGTKGVVAYQLIRMLRNKTQKVEKEVISEPLNVATRPVSIMALTATAYSVSKLTKYRKLQRYLLNATISTAIVGLISSGIKAIATKKSTSKNPVTDTVNEMVTGPTDKAAAIAAVGGALPHTSGPLLAASAAGLAASTIINNQKKNHRHNQLSKILLGGCIGFAAAHVVKKLEQPVRKERNFEAQEDVGRFEPEKPYIPKKMEPILDSWGGQARGH